MKNERTTEWHITEPLLTWYEKVKRPLPWRQAPEAYHVWVSEIMLQQTRVEAVKPYYARFLQQLPDIAALAQAKEEQLLKLWEGLGYYNRVRNMQKAARIVVERYGGQLPKDYEAVRGLPGIGSYTAGAICSIAFGIPVPAVDGNVLRVISRVLAKDWDIAKAGTKKQIEALLSRIIPKDAPGQFNQALMELGATVCVPNGMAKCRECPLARLCLANRQDRVMDLPVKSEKKPRRVQEMTVLILKWQDKTALGRRPDQGLLAGMYELPNLPGYLEEKQVLSYLREQNVKALRIRPLPAAKHIFTHVEWRMKGYLILLDETEACPGEWIFADREQIRDIYALPAAFSPYLPEIFGDGS